MKTYWLHTRLWLPQNLEEIFDFFANPHNLDCLTPAWLRFRILSPAKTVMRAGTKLDYRLRLRGVPIRWKSEITDWEPPHRFVDRQTKGPYSLWVHEHTFASQDGGTLIGDNVEYAVPGGSIVQRFFVAPDIARIFAYRHQVLQERFNPGNIQREQGATK